jgi:Ulp1 family protease
VKAQHRLSNPRGWLNDEAINSVAQLMLWKLLPKKWFNHSKACSVFNSYAFTLVSHNVDDYNLFRNCRDTVYWNRPIWLIPIHREAALHWVLAVVQHKRKTIFFYDPQGIVEASSWADELRVLSGLLLCTACH